MVMSDRAPGSYDDNPVVNLPMAGATPEDDTDSRHWRPRDSRVTRWVREHGPFVEGTRLATLLTLAEFVDPETGRARVSEEKLAHECGRVDARTIRRHIAHFKQAGSWFEVIPQPRDGKPGHFNEYQFFGADTDWTPVREYRKAFPTAKELREMEFQKVMARIAELEQRNAGLEQLLEDAGLEIPEDFQDDGEDAVAVGETVFARPPNRIPFSSNNIYLEEYGRGDREDIQKLSARHTLIDEPRNLVDSLLPPQPMSDIYNPDGPPAGFTAGYAQVMLRRYAATWLSAWTQLGEPGSPEQIEKVVRWYSVRWKKFIEDLARHRANELANIPYGRPGMAVDETVTEPVQKKDPVLCVNCGTMTLLPLKFLKLSSFDQSRFPDRQLGETVTEFCGDCGKGKDSDQEDIYGTSEHGTSG